MLLFRLLIFFTNYIFNKFVKKYHQRDNQIGSFCGGANLGPNCLHEISADDTSRQNKHKHEENARSLW